MRHVLALLLLMGCAPEPPPDLDDDNADADDDDSAGNGNGNEADSNDNCVADSDQCGNNSDCCGFGSGDSVCVYDGVAANWCLPTCTGPSECSTDCCQALDIGGGACVPEEYCGGGTTYSPGSSGGTF